MKISNYIGTIALFAMFAACSTEEEQVRFAGNEVKVNAAIGRESTFTRSNPAGNEEEQSNFKNYDQIGISMNDGAARLYEMNNGVWEVKDGEPLKWEKEANEFKAFYPYSYAYKSYNSFDKGHLTEVQTSVEGLAISDYMTTDLAIPYIPENRELDLKFKRRTARVIIDIQNSTFTNEFDNPYVAGVTIFSQLEIPATQGADVTEINPYKMEDPNPKSSWMALVAPNAKDESKNFICIMVQEINTDDPAKPYYVKGIPNLEENKSYTYKLKIGKDRATIENVTVENWTDGTVIPGGAVSSITVDGIKESVTTQLEKGNDVVLTLNSNASSDIFDAIKTAIKDKGVADGSVNLTLKGVVKIPEKAFDNSTNAAPWFNKVTLPDVTIIKNSAFRGSTLKSIDAPNVEEIGLWTFMQSKFLEEVSMPKVSAINLLAFADCSSLRKVSFGALDTVYAEAEDDGGIFKGVPTQTNVELTLSSRQGLLWLAELPDGTFIWSPITSNYWDKSDYAERKILGYKFKDIYCADD